jgi:23S rRNA pseudouridine2605 synthase
VKAVRLNKYLAECGYGSRRKAEAYILDGSVKVNGIVVNELSTVINPVQDEVTVNGKPIAADEKKLYLLLNKPRGYLVTRSDEYERRTVYKLLPDFAQNCVSAGRLDKDSEGLLLITNDGDVVQALTHPTKKIEKVYRAEIDQPIYKDQLDDLRRGVVIEGYRTRSASVYVKSNSYGNVVLKIVITEGKKRQVRLMLEAVDRRVINLKRLQVGDLELGKLPTGMWRECNSHEIGYLRGLAKSLVKSKTPPASPNADVNQSATPSKSYKK